MGGSQPTASHSLLEKSNPVGDMTPDKDMNINIQGGEQVNVKDLYDLVATGRLSELALSALLAQASDPLAALKYQLATDPANTKIVKLGDSNSDGGTSASTLYRRLYYLHAQAGEALEGLGSSDFFTDGVGNGTSTFTSATANFTADDIGRAIVGRNIPAGGVITGVTNSTTATVTNTVSSGTGLPFAIGRHIIAGGNNGRPLNDWFALPSETYPTMPYSRDRLVADNPHAIFHEWLTNDIRTGLLGDTVADCFTNGRARLQAWIEWCLTNMPDVLAHILVTPATFLSANTGGLNYVTNSVGTINPAGQAQIYSTALRRIYLSFVGQYRNVVVMDTQGNVFGTRSCDTSDYMANQIHPSVSTPNQSDLFDLYQAGGGYNAVADQMAELIGTKRNAFPNSLMRRTRQEFIVYQGNAAGSIRLISRDPVIPAMQTPVFRTDTLYVNGLTTPIALTSATISRAFSTQWLEISGLGATDFSPYTGKTATVFGAHAGSTGESVFVSVDLASIAATTTVTVNMTVPGVQPGNVGYRVGALANPGAGFASTALVLLSCIPVSTDTVECTIENPTGAPIDVGAESWTFVLTR